MTTAKEMEKNRRQHESTYLGYINGRLTRFFLKYIPATDEYIKVEVA